MFLVVHAFRTEGGRKRILSPEAVSFPCGLLCIFRFGLIFCPERRNSLRFHSHSWKGDDGSINEVGGRIQDI